MLSITTLTTFVCALLYCTAVHGNEETEENEVFELTIAEDGNNSLACLSGDISCLTLDYVLKNLGSEYPEDSDPVTVRIEVQYEHIVGGIDSTFYSSTNIEIYSKRPIILCFNRTDYFSSSSGSNVLRGNYNVSIYFTDLMFHGCDDIDSREIAPVTLTFLGFRSVTFHRCSIVNGSSLELLIRNVSQTAITSCKFRHSSFSAGALSIHYTPYIEKKVEFLIKDNEFINNTATGVVYAAVFPVLSQAIAFNIPYLRSSLDNLTVIIDNCTVKDIRKWTSNPILRIGVENSEQIVSGNFVFKNTLFTNLVGLSDLIYLRISSYIQSNNTNIKIDVNNCNFTNNRLYSASFVRTRFRGQSQTQLDITDSLFYGNQASCMYIRAYSSTNVAVSLQNSLVRGNFGEQLFDMYCSSLGCSMIFDKVEMMDNTAADLTENLVSTVNPKYALVEIIYFSVKVENSTFHENYGTSLHLTRSNLTFVGESLFAHNFALRGGALALHDLTFLKFEKKGKIDCQYNVADFGGALYLSSVNSNNCYFDPNICYDNHFLGNRGRIDGNIMYVTDETTAFCIRDYAERCLSNGTRHLEQVGTPTVFQNFTSDRARIFPGQNIPFGLTVLNFFNKSAVINVRVLLQCEGAWFLCEPYGYTLTGPHLATFTSREMSPSEYILNTPSENFNESHNLRILVLGQEQLSTHSTLILEVLRCPYGFAFNSTTGNCECLQLNRQFYFCSQRLGIACVAQGYWLGDINNGTNSIAFCYSEQCNRQPRPCPAIVNSASVSFMELFQHSDDQCTNNLGGILCAGCRNGAKHTFEGLLCIPSGKCHPWQPYFLLILSLVFQIVSCILLLGMLRLKLGFGLGYLYGPVFFLAVVTKLPYTSKSEFSTLRAIVSFITSIFFLDLEWVGFIPLCTFDIGRLSNYAFRYIGPVIASLVIFITFLVARKCPKLLAFLQESPVQAICLLLFLSFWSLAETSWTILSFSDVSGSGSYTEIRVLLQPDLHYFTGVHIFLAIVALIVIFVLVLPFTLFLFCTPCIARKVDLTRIKPILDEFHSCYKINFRWYSGVYIIGWIGLIMFATSPLLILTELAVLLFSHTLLQPYQNKWLNIIDALLLTDSLFLFAILNGDNPALLVGMEIFLVYVLVLLPFLYIFIGLLLIVGQRTGFLNYIMTLIKSKKYTMKLMKKNKKNLVTSTVVTINNPILTTDIQMSFADVHAQELREPLLEDKL